MTQMIKGGNLPLSGEPMRVAVVRRSGGPGDPRVDAAALLVAADGTVRSGEDLVFYNQPEHAGSGVRLSGSAHGEGGVLADWLEIDPGRVEPDVERIVVAASCDDATFGEVTGLYLRAVSATTGEQFALYEVEDATTETAILLGEFYRRGGGWKVRAVGQGYDSGLPGLAKDFGFAVPEVTDSAVTDPEVPGVADEVPETVPAPAPVFVPAQAPGFAFARCNDLPEQMGPEFAPVEFSGRGKEVVDTGLDLAKGFVAVDLVKEGDGFVEVVTLTIRGRRWREVLKSRPAHAYGVGVFAHDGQAPPRLRVDAGDGTAWTLRLRPVSTLRAFEGPGPVEGFGPDVLAYTGDETDVRYRFEGDEDKEGYFGVEVHRRGGHWQHQFSRRDRGRGGGALPRGPRLLVVEADGGWSMEPRKPRIAGFWTRR
ncbi:TerD family protein [Streptomyces sp. NPDC056144]|uniref:TerD family protein n=1 Tax=unclassified Streptomyces TaxID=2593676 RepID=UPI0035D9F84B